MPLPFDPTSEFQGSAAQQAISGFMGGYKARPIVTTIPNWWGKVTQVIPSAKLKEYAFIPVHSGVLKAWAGQFDASEGTRIPVLCQRGMKHIGASCRLIGVASEFDGTGWDMQPGTMATKIGNNAPTTLAACINGLFSNVAQDELGNKLAAQLKITMGDQVYGGNPNGQAQPMAILKYTTGAQPNTTPDGLYDWVTSTVYAAGNLAVSNGNVYQAIIAGTSGATAPTGTAASVSDGTVTWKYIYAQPSQKPINPADPAQYGGASFYTAHSNFPITPANILTVLEEHQNRRDMSNIPLGLGGRNGVELWVPSTSEELARQYTEVMSELAGSGVIAPLEVTYTSNGTPATQVVYGSQTNPVFGRSKVVMIPGVRQDIWRIQSPAPVPDPQYMTFLFSHGGTAKSYQVQNDPGAVINDSVPHIAVFVWDQNSPPFFGVNNIPAGTIMINMIVHEGFATQSDLLGTTCFTGNAS